MALQFENPWLLLLILPAAVFIYYTTKNMIKMTHWKKTTIVVFRSLIFLIIILLLSGFTIKLTANTATTLFLIDSSDSIKQKKQGEDFIREALKNMGRNDEAGIINFGENYAIELLPIKNPSFTNAITPIVSS
jgi:Ca-activated chloride channel family protein